MLPVAAYTDPDVLGWERAHFFAGTWTCLGRRPAGRPAGVRGRRHQRAGPVASDDAVRAFANVCRHRGHELLPGRYATPPKRAIVCPYHGWAYRLDGSLAVAPQMGADFDRAPWGLSPLPAVDWHGWLFVNASGGAAPFADFVGESRAYVAPYAPERLHRRTRPTVTRSRPTGS